MPSGNASRGFRSQNLVGPRAKGSPQPCYRALSPKPSALHGRYLFSWKPAGTATSSAFTDVVTCTTSLVVVRKVALALGSSSFFAALRASPPSSPPTLRWFDSFSSCPAAFSSASCSGDLTDSIVTVVTIGVPSTLPASAAHLASACLICG